MKVFSNANWGCYTETRKSLTCYCIILGSCLISWKTNKQITIAKFSAETEYRALATTVSEVLWITYVFRDFQIKIPQPIVLYCDNLVVIHMVKNPMHHERTKHIDIDCHFVRDHYAKGLIKPVYIKSKDHVANMFTKVVPSGEFNY